jgi:hypothetical protein
MANTPSTTRPTAAKKVTRPATKRAAKKVTASKPDPKVIAAAETVIDAKRSEFLGNQEERGRILYETAVHFHQVVLTSKVMTQNRYAALFYGTRNDKGQVVDNSATAMATLLKRLADAAVRLGVERDSDEWRWLVQNGTSAVGGQHVKEAAKGKALTILRRNVREYAKTGKNASASRKAGGSTNQMAKGKGTRVPTPARSRRKRPHRAPTASRAPAPRSPSPHPVARHPYGG